MIYVVSGHFRSGTSMMMHALAAGGLVPAWSDRREWFNRVYGDAHYQPNAHGFYEIPFADYDRPGFPLPYYEGRLIKVLWWGLAGMSPNGTYRVVVMLRHPEEIRQSFGAFFGRRLDMPEGYEAHMAAQIEALRARPEVTGVEAVHYREVVEAPRDVFERLARTGWPIDAEAAAATVEPALYRFRLERLTVGI